MRRSGTAYSPPDLVGKVTRRMVLLFLLGVGSAVSAEVLNLDAGEFSTRKGSNGAVVSGVLDFGRPKVSAPETEIAPEISAPSLGARVSRRGEPQVEALIQKVALEHARHGGIKAAGLSTVEWLAFFRANIAIESNFRQSARSHVGAIGLGQLMPETARQLGVNPYDATENLRGSARYLLTQLERFKSKELALAAYNAGPHRVEQYGGIPPYRETQQHVSKVLKIYLETVSQEAT